MSEEILTLDDIAAILHGMATPTVPFDPDLIERMADQVGEAADRAQEVADLRTAVALLSDHRLVAG